MKKTTYFLLAYFVLLLLLNGCEKDHFPLPRKKICVPEFKVGNESSDVIEWMQISIRDTEKSYLWTDIDEPSVHYDPIVFFKTSNPLLQHKQLPDFSQDIRKISKTGYGSFLIQAKKVGSADTLSTLFGYYHKYNIVMGHYEYAYSTYEITFTDPDSTSTYPQNGIKISISKYKDGKKIASEEI